MPVTGLEHLLSDQPWISGSHNPLFGFDNLLGWLMELRETVYLLLLVYYKDCCKGYKWTARWRGAQGEVQRGPGHRRGAVPPPAPARGCVHHPPVLRAWCRGPTASLALVGDSVSTPPLFLTLTVNQEVKFKQQIIFHTHQKWRKKQNYYNSWS